MRSNLVSRLSSAPSILNYSNTGNYTVNINNDFSNANHASIESSGAYHAINDAGNAAGTLNIGCFNSSHSAADESRVAVHSCGDLA